MRVDLLRSLAVAVLDEPCRRVELHLDLAGPARVVWLHGTQILQRLLRAVLDQLACLLSRQLSRAELTQPLLHGDSGEPLAEQLAAFAADGLVTRDEQHGTAPLTAQRRVDACLANGGAVELQLAPRLTGHGMREYAVGCAGLRVHPDEERGIATLLEQLGVLGPVVLHDELAVWIELVRNQGVERPLYAGAVAVHD